MFISKLEKQQINELIMTLQMKVEVLQNDVIFLTGKVKALEGKPQEPVSKPKKKRTDEQKARQAAYMKEWHSRKRQEKLQAKAVGTNELKVA